MKLIVNTIVGLLMYRAHGDGQIDKAYGHLTVDEPFKLDLDR